MQLKVQAFGLSAQHEPGYYPALVAVVAVYSLVGGDQELAAAHLGTRILLVNSLLYELYLTILTRMPS